MNVWFGLNGLLHHNHALVQSEELTGQSAGTRRGLSGRPESRSRPRRLGYKRRPLVALIALAAAGALAAGCSSNNAGSGGSSSGGTSSGGTSSGGSRSGGYGGGGSAGTSPTGAATVTAASTKLGMALVDGSGRTLYLFQKDQPNQSACSGACASAWPADKSSGTPTAGSGVNASLLGTIKHSGPVQPSERRGRAALSRVSGPMPDHWVFRRPTPTGSAIATVGWHQGES